MVATVSVIQWERWMHHALDVVETDPLVVEDQVVSITGNILERLILQVLCT